MAMPLIGKRAGVTASTGATPGAVDGLALIIIARGFVSDSLHFVLYACYVSSFLKLTPM
jgi:hypothetical protein